MRECGLLARHEDLVGEQLHRHRQIERAIFGIGGNAHQHVAVIQILGAETVALRAEQQCGAILRAEPDDAGRHLARRRELPVVGARARGRAGDEAAVRDAPPRRCRPRAHAPECRRRPRRARSTRHGETSAAAPASDPSSAMFFMARATEPMLPGWLGSMRTMRTRRSCSVILARSYATTSQYRHARRAPRRRSDRAQPVASRFAEDRHQGPQRFRDRHRPQGGGRHHRRRSGAAIPITRSSARRPAAAATASTCGSSTRSTAPRIFCMAFRPSPSRSRSSTAAGCSTRVVYDPMRQEFFTASRGDGAQLEGKKIRVSSQRTLEGALIGTGFPYRMAAEHIDDYLAMLKVVMTTAAGVRRPGAASLDLAYVAAGRIGRLLGIRLEALGYRGRDAAHPGGRRPRRHAGGRRICARARTSSPAIRRSTRRCSRRSDR